MRDRGFTLIEVLIALLVLSIGLLGMARLSVTSVQANGSAYMRSQASALAQQILDAMHANRTAAVAGGYNIAFGAAAADPGIACTATSCALGGSTAAYDLFVWKQRLSSANAGGALPSGDGAIAVATTVVNGRNQTTAIVQVKWDDSVAQRALGLAGGPQTLTVEGLL